MERTNAKQIILNEAEMSLAIVAVIQRREKFREWQQQDHWEPEAREGFDDEIAEMDEFLKDARACGFQFVVIG